MKLRVILLIACLTLNVKSMEYLPESDTEEQNMPSSEQSNLDLKNAACILVNLKEANSKSELRCYKCNEKLIFQNELNLENIKINRILCPACRKAKKKLSQSK